MISKGKRFPQVTQARCKRAATARVGRRPAGEAERRRREGVAAWPSGKRPLPANRAAKCPGSRNSCGAGARTRRSSAARRRPARAVVDNLG